MEKFHGEDLQVGDKVIVFASSLQVKRYYVGTVVKRTPTGLLDVEFNGGKLDRFKSDGTEYNRSSGSLYSTRYYLEDYTEERANEIIMSNKKMSMQKILKEYDYTKLSFEEIEQVYKLVAGFKK